MKNFTKIVALACCMGLAGCAVPLESVKANSAPRASVELSERCQELDSLRTWASGFEIGGLTLASAQGLGSVVLPDSMTQDERDKWQLGLSLGTVGAVVIAGVAYEIEQRATESWARECS